MGTVDSYRTLAGGLHPCVSFLRVSVPGGSWHMGGVGCGGRASRGGAESPYFPPMSNQQWRTWSRVLGAPSLRAM